MILFGFGLLCLVFVYLCAVVCYVLRAFLLMCCLWCNDVFCLFAFVFVCLCVASVWFVLRVFVVTLLYVVLCVVVFVCFVFDFVCSCVVIVWLVLHAYVVKVLSLVFAVTCSCYLFVFLLACVLLVSVMFFVRLLFKLLSLVLWFVFRVIFCV